MKTILVASVAAFLSVAALPVDAQGTSNTPIKFETEVPQRLDARFRLFKTHNIFNSLLLDTRTGRILQVQFNPGKTEETWWKPLNDKSLVADEKGSKDGRFTLYETLNILNFLLLDQETGKLWQVQYAAGDAPPLVRSINEVGK